MKKKLLAPFIALGLLFGVNTYCVVKSVNTERLIEENRIQLRAVEDEEEETSSKIQQLKDKITELMNSQLITSVVSYSTTLTGVLGFIITFFKFRKYKAISSENIATIVSKLTSEEIAKKYEELEKTLVQELKLQIDNVDSALAVLQKIIVLAQDKSKEGQLLLLEYLDTKTEDVEVKEVIDKVEEKIEEEIKTDEEVLSNVSDEYTPIE